MDTNSKKVSLINRIQLVNWSINICIVRLINEDLILIVSSKLIGNSFYFFPIYCSLVYLKWISFVLLSTRDRIDRSGTVWWCIIYGWPMLIYSNLNQCLIVIRILWYQHIKIFTFEASVPSITNAAHAPNHHKLSPSLIIFSIWTFFWLTWLPDTIK